MMKRIIRNDGVRGFYNGFGVHALHSGLLNGLFVMIYANVYSRLKAQMAPH